MNLTEAKMLPAGQPASLRASSPTPLSARLPAFLPALQLPAYGVLLVHAGLVPGVPLSQQRLEDLERMRDVIPAAEQEAADAAAAEMVADGAAALASLPSSSFDWEAAAARLAQLAAAGRGMSASSSGAGGAGVGATPAAAVPSGVPAELALLGREVPNPLGKAWASIWQGPHHVFFGHDAKRWVGGPFGMCV
jgi:hypothetical protein